MHSIQLKRLCLAHDAILLCTVLLAVNVLCQTSSTGTLIGTVRDSSDNVVPGAQVELSNDLANVKRHFQTNALGQYTFSGLEPGMYKVIVSAKGFRTATLDATILVAKSAVADVTLQVGSVSETVQVSASSPTQLQTLDSSIGSVLEQADIVKLPTTQRRAGELIYLQPATTPVVGIGSSVGGSVAGGRADQNSATLDGINVTDIYSGQGQGDVSAIPLPVDAIQEFRGTVSNPNETMGRTSGGFFSFTTRRGTNSVHGAGYWYRQDVALDANSWTNDRLGKPKLPLTDNRFGGRIGGPIRRNKDYGFLFYEGRRFPQSTNAERIGISDTLRNGILRFRDGTGNIVSYDLRTSAACGAAGNTPCDPRALGISPVIQNYFKMYPKANDPSGGDGLNTIGILAPVDTSTHSDFGLGRLDHNITDNWHLSGSYVFQQARSQDLGQISFDPSVTGGRLLKSTSSIFQNNRVVAVALTGQITPNINNDFRFGYNRQGLPTQRRLATPPVAGAGLVLNLAGATLDDPDDTSPLTMRPFFTQSSSWQFNDNLMWVKANHLISAGVNYMRLQSRQARYDRVSSLVIPEANVTAGQFVTVPSTSRPPVCGSVQANCLQSQDVGTWNALYGAVLGIWDNTQAFYPRDSKGNPLGIVPIASDGRWQHMEFSGGDVWRIRKSLTVSYGLNFAIDTPLREAHGLKSIIVDAATGKPIQPLQQLALKKAAAERGQVYNQQISYVPVNSLGGNIYPTSHNFGPRLSVAWSPSFHDKPLHALFGNNRTVIRGGYSLLYTSNLAVVPNLVTLNGNQLQGNSGGEIAPACDLAGSPGPGCQPGVSPFRIGIDGGAFLPPPGPFTIPFVPGTRNTLTGKSFGVVGGAALDPHYHPGHIHGGNLTLQRQFSDHAVVEMGWIGRYGRDFPAGVNLNAPPVNLKDMSGKSNQTFAQAFDSVATELRAGTLPSAVTPQPWLENVFGAGGTQTFATSASSNISQGLLARVFINTIDPMLQAAGKPTVLNQQYNAMLFETNGSWSNYNALFSSLKLGPMHGVNAAVNWTWAHCLDTGERIEGSGAGAWTNPYSPGFDYGDCITDRRHVIQSYGSYDLPFKSKSRVASGWYTSYILVSTTGLPFVVRQGGEAFGAPIYGGVFPDESVPSIGPVPSTGLHRGVAGSSGIGSAGDPANGGTGLNLFADPAATYKSLRYFLLSRDTRSHRGLFRGLGYWNLDASLGKRTSITERVSVGFSADFFNILNHPNFMTPGGIFPRADLNSPANFGVITSEVVADPSGGDSNSGPRRIQLGLRIEF